jgi:hypothetical protein
MQIDQDVGKRLLEFDQARRQPECSKALGDGDPDLARKRMGDGFAGAQQVERSRLHAFDRRNNQRAFVGQACSMDVAREQRGADLALKVVNSPADDVNGKVKPLRRGPEASTADHFQKNPGRIPIRETSYRGLLAFLLRNAPFQHQTHTRPFPPAKLGRIWVGPQLSRVYGFPFCRLYLPSGPAPPGFYGLRPPVVASLRG